jgi:hypothetical protein
LGYYIGTKDKISEQNVVLPKDKAMPWQQEGNEDGDLFKYKVRPSFMDELTSSIIQRVIQELLPDRYVPCVPCYQLFTVSRMELMVGTGGFA